MPAGPRRAPACAQEPEEKVAEKPAANGRPAEDAPAAREAPKGIPALPSKPKQQGGSAAAAPPAPATPEAV